VCPLYRSSIIDGKILSHEIGEVHRLLLREANLGHAEAQYDLSYVYMWNRYRGGGGVKQSNMESLRCYKIAAHQGNPTQFTYDRGKILGQV